MVKERYQRWCSLATGDEDFYIGYQPSTGECRFCVSEDLSVRQAEYLMDEVCSDGWYSIDLDLVVDVLEELFCMMLDENGEIYV